MTNKNSTAFIFKTYRQPITVINLTEANFNHGKDCLRATEIRKGLFKGNRNQERTQSYKP